MEYWINKSVLRVNIVYKIEPSSIEEHLLKYIKFGSEKYEKGEFYIYLSTIGLVTITKKLQVPHFNETAYKYFISNDLLYKLWQIRSEEYYESACFCGFHDQL